MMPPLGALLALALSGPRAAPDSVPLYSDLGNHHHEVTTKVPRAQQFFDQGLRLVFGRSEEHTSELQSLAYLVCRLLLEKKNFNWSSAVAMVRNDWIVKPSSEAPTAFG